MEHDAETLVELLRTDDAGFLPVIKSVLEAAEIPYAVQGEEALGLLPVGLLAIGVPKPLVCAIVRVPSSYLDEATDLVNTPAEPIQEEDGETR
jgi:hypothetical protein